MQRSKRYKAQAAKLTSEAVSVDEAIKFIQGESQTKFDQSVELHLSLGVDPKKAEQLIRGSVVLPAGTGKVLKIMAFVSPEQEKAAKTAGADLIGDAETIQKIKETGKIDFDIAVATPVVMRNLAPIAKTLGQKGLMPNPKTETVSPNIEKMIGELKKGKANFRNDEGGNIHQLVGKVSFSVEDLTKNIETFIEHVKKLKPETIKGVYIKSITLTSSMGPGIKVKV